MIKQQFVDVTKTWVAYWGCVPLNEIRAKEYWGRFSGWTEARYNKAHQEWSDSGKKFPEKADLVNADRKLRAASKSKSAVNPLADLNLHIEMGFALLRAKLAGKAAPPMEFTSAFPMAPLVEQAFEYFEKADPPEHYSDRMRKASKESVAYGSLSVLITRNLGGH